MRCESQSRTRWSNAFETLVERGRRSWRCASGDLRPELKAGEGDFEEGAASAEAGAPGVEPEAGAGGDGDVPVAGLEVVEGEIGAPVAGGEDAVGGGRGDRALATAFCVVEQTLS